MTCVSPTRWAESGSRCWASHWSAGRGSGCSRWPSCAGVCSRRWCCPHGKPWERKLLFTPQSVWQLKTFFLSRRVAEQSSASSWGVLRNIWEVSRWLMLAGSCYFLNTGHFLPFSAAKTIPQAIDYFNHLLSNIAHDHEFIRQSITVLWQCDIWPALWHHVRVHHVWRYFCLSAVCSHKQERHKKNRKTKTMKKRCLLKCLCLNNTILSVLRYTEMRYDDWKLGSIFSQTFDFFIKITRGVFFLIYFLPDTRSNPAQCERVEPEKCPVTIQWRWTYFGHLIDGEDSW